METIQNIITIVASGAAIIEFILRLFNKRKKKK